MSAWSASLDVFAISGHTAAPPPTSVMNSRRFIAASNAFNLNVGIFSEKV
jgi:hypothetical protein